MQLPDESSLQAWRDGRCEAGLLERTRAECYAASASTFLAPAVGQRWRRAAVDESALAAGRARQVAWPGGAPYAVCLTHDVDHVSSSCQRIHWRKLRAQLLSLGRSFQPRAWRALRGTLAASLRGLGRSAASDPLHAYERWLELEDEVGARSTFFFLPEQYAKPHFSDGGYRYDDRIRFDGQPCTVADMMREIRRRGWEVGLHASWNSWNSAELMRDQKQQVERAAGTVVASVRHHHLHFDIRRTPQVQEQAGLLYDSSLGFNDAIGFRNGTCLPWRIASPSGGERLTLVEIPLLMQDKCLVKFAARGDLPRALRIADRLVRQVSRLGGVLTVLWHPGLIRDPLYVAVYRELLQRFKDSGAWFGAMAEVGQWWRSATTQPRRRRA